MLHRLLVSRPALFVHPLSPTVFHGRLRYCNFTTSTLAGFPDAALPKTDSKASSDLSKTPICPPSACHCASMPEGLAIDHDRELNGTMPPYAQHVVIRTGRSDWSSRITDDPATLGKEAGGINLAAALQALVGRGGKYFDPQCPVLLSYSSARRTLRPRSDRSIDQPDWHAIDIFPQCHFHGEVLDDAESLNAFVRNCVVGPRKSDAQLDERRKVKKNARPAIFICGHNARDTRCGILGPILQAEFIRQISEEVDASPLPLQRVNHPKRKGESAAMAGRISLLHHLKSHHPLRYTRVALCSHIGGHAFAGNVVIYFPPHFRTVGHKEKHPLAGKGIWYGRVEPKHVWGIIQETVKSGRIIEELLRGVHGATE